jgi:hypothetical protein
MNVLSIFVAILAVWRLTHLLQFEGGPFDLIAGWRNLLRRVSLSGLVDCFFCLSLWLAAPLAYIIGPSWKERLMLWPALSGGAILLERIVEPPSEIASYNEDPIPEEKPPCVAEKPEAFQPRILSPIPAQFEWTTPSCRPRCSGTRVEAG